MKKCLFTLFFLFFCLSASSDDRGLPVVEEHVDQIWVIYQENSEYARVYFVYPANKAGEQQWATRTFLEEMVWYTTTDGKLAVSWRDYWTCERIITFDDYNTTVLPYDPFQQEQRGQWWCMWRNMVDLKQPSP